MDSAKIEERTEVVATAFGRDCRLRNRWQLGMMREHGRKAVGKHCVVVALESPPDGQRRAAFLISRKYSLLAVDRNRSRRLFRESYRRLVASLPPVWLLFIPRQRMKESMQPEIEGEIVVLLRELGVLGSEAVAR